MPDELMDMLIGECFEKATYSRKNRTDTPAVHLKKTGFCEPFGKYLLLPRRTGARPGVLRYAEAFNYVGGPLVFRWNAERGYVWKNANDTQRDHIIFLPPDAQAYVEECVKKHAEGPIFRTLRCDPWSPQNVTQKWRQFLLKRPKVTAYLEEQASTRSRPRLTTSGNSAISKGLDAGGDIYVASQLLGTSVKMLARYCHPDIDRLHERYMAFAASNPLAMPWATADAAREQLPAERQPVGFPPG